MTDVKKENDDVYIRGEGCGISFCVMLLSCEGDFKYNCALALVAIF